MSADASVVKLRTVFNSKPQALEVMPAIGLHGCVAATAAGQIRFSAS